MSVQAPADDTEPNFPGPRGPLSAFDLPGRNKEKSMLVDLILIAFLSALGLGQPTPSEPVDQTRAEKPLVPETETCSQGETGCSSDPNG